MPTRNFQRPLSVVLPDAPGHPARISRMRVDEREDEAYNLVWRPALATQRRDSRVLPAPAWHARLLALARLVSCGWMHFHTATVSSATKHGTSRILTGDGSGRATGAGTEHLLAPRTGMG